MDPRGALPAPALRRTAAAPSKHHSPTGERPARREVDSAHRPEDDLKTRLSLALALAALVAAGGLPRADAGTPERVGYDPARDPTQDLAAAETRARASDRRILLEVGGEWCTWCHILARFLHDHADLEKLWTERFVVVRVNVSRENRNQDFLSRYPKVPGYPHLFVLDSSGRLLHSQDTSQLEEGKSYSHARLLAFLERWSASGDG